MQSNEANLVVPQLEPVLVEPRYPLLDAKECWDGVSDKRSDLTPEEQVRLRPEEVVVDIHYRDSQLPQRPVAAETVLMLATGVNRPDVIGRYGPSVASVNLDPSQPKSRYENMHGRDGLISAWAAKQIYPDWLASEVLALATLQGVDDEVFDPAEPYGFEKPGSIILVKYAPDDPMGRKFEQRKGWRSPFYASVDAPGLFAQALAHLQEQDPAFLFRVTYTDRNNVTNNLTRAFDLSVKWLTDRMDENPAGLIEYRNPYTDGRGMRNQGWKDSADSMVHKDGSWVNAAAGVAPIEVQAQAVSSLRAAAKVYRELYENDELASGLEERADRLLNFILDNGWVEDQRGGHVVMGWDHDEQGQLRPIETRSIDMYSMLPLLDMADSRQRAMALQTVRNLVSPAMLTRWGNRVMANDEAGYGDFRYHCGVWAHQSNLVAEAMSKIGLHGLDRFLGGLTTNLINRLGCFPEHVAGNDAAEPEFSSKDIYVYNRRYNELHLAEQVPPLGQTWGAATEIGKRQRYQQIPLTAQEPVLRQFEAELLEELQTRWG